MILNTCIMQCKKNITSYTYSWRCCNTPAWGQSFHSDGYKEWVLACEASWRVYLFYDVPDTLWLLPLEVYALWNILSLWSFAVEDTQGHWRAHWHWGGCRWLHHIGCGDNIKEAVRNYDKNLLAFLQTCEECNVRLNAEKMKLGQHEVLFISHMATDKGLKVDPSKVRAIAEMPDLNSTWQTQEHSYWHPCSKLLQSSGRGYTTMWCISVRLGAALLQNEQPIAYTLQAATHSSGDMLCRLIF